VSVAGHRAYFLRDAGVLLNQVRFVAASSVGWAGLTHGTRV
jgi:hypothetical protein